MESPRGRGGQEEEVAIHVHQNMLCLGFVRGVVEGLEAALQNKEDRLREQFPSGVTVTLTPYRGDPLR